MKAKMVPSSLALPLLMSGVAPAKPSRPASAAAVEQFHAIEEKKVR
jgi:hypothetical protein